MRTVSLEKKLFFTLSGIKKVILFLQICEISGIHHRKNATIPRLQARNGCKFFNLDSKKNFTKPNSRTTKRLVIFVSINTFHGCFVAAKCVSQHIFFCHSCLATSTCKRLSVYSFNCKEFLGKVFLTFENTSNLKFCTLTCQQIVSKKACISL